MSYEFQLVHPIEIQDGILKWDKINISLIEREQLFIELLDGSKVVARIGPIHISPNGTLTLTGVNPFKVFVSN